MKGRRNYPIKGENEFATKMKNNIAILWKLLLVVGAASLILLLLLVIASIPITEGSTTPRFFEIWLSVTFIIISLGWILAVISSYKEI